MPTFETIDPKLAIRCRYAQHRGKKATMILNGSLITGLIRSVMEIKSNNSTRWIITVVAKPSIAA
jgi:hypothetical protein